MDFRVVSDFTPTGDQPKAIDQLVKGIETGDKFQTLLGVTGLGKTFTMANVVERVQRPTLVLAHNKTLLLNSIQSSNNFFLTMRLNILCHTTTIINQKHISQRQAPTSKKTFR